MNNGLGVALGTADNRVNVGDQLILVERLGQVVVRAEAQAANLLIDAAHAGKNEDRCLDLVYAERAQNLVSADIGQAKIQQNNIVIVDLAEAHAFLSKVGLENVKSFGKQHQLNALSGCCIVFYKKHSHGIPRLLQV